MKGLIPAPMAHGWYPRLDYCSRYFLLLPGELCISLIIDFRLGHMSFSTTFLLENYISLLCWTWVMMWLALVSEIQVNICVIFELWLWEPVCGSPSVCFPSATKSAMFREEAVPSTWVLEGKWHGAGSQLTPNGQVTWARIKSQFL